MIYSPRAHPLLHWLICIKPSVNKSRIPFMPYMEVNTSIYGMTCMIDGNFGNVSADVLFSKVAYQRKRW